MRGEEERSDEKRRGEERSEEERRTLDANPVPQFPSSRRTRTCHVMSCTHAHVRPTAHDKQ